MPIRFSIVLCTYNGERFVGEQLYSILNQTRLPDEIVVRDDASTDRTVEVIRACKAPVPIRISVNESNLGSTANFERGIADARGDLIALCDQDDVWEPEKLERLEAAFKPGIGLVFTDAELINDEGRRLGRRLWHEIDLRGAQLRHFADEPLRVLARGKNVVTGATLAFRADLREFVLPIPRVWTHDGWIAIIAAFRTSFRMIPEPLIRYRVHSQQQLGLKPPVSSALREPEAFRKQLRQYEHVVERVRPFADPRKLRWLEGLAGHLRTRAEMSSFRPARACAVARELFACRYHRYSNGFLSVFKDLFSQ